MPDYDYIRRELLRKGVDKRLLWVEYCEECRMNGEEHLMYSQFCYYIQKDGEKRRATMHIPRKPGEQIEVDWAGESTQLIDPDTGNDRAAGKTDGRYTEESWLAVYLLRVADADKYIECAERVVKMKHPLKIKVMSYL